MTAIGTDAQIAMQWRDRAVTLEDRVRRLERLLRTASTVLEELGESENTSYPDRTIRLIDKALKENW